MAHTSPDAVLERDRYQYELFLQSAISEVETALAKERRFPDRFPNATRLEQEIDFLRDIQFPQPLPFTPERFRGSGSFPTADFAKRFSGSGRSVSSVIQAVVRNADAKDSFESDPDHLGSDAMHTPLDHALDPSAEKNTQNAASASETQWHLLATPEGLIDVFGSFSGMNMSWFYKAKDRPQLLAARYSKGLGQKSGIKPLYRVFEVMQFLINPKRRCGRRMQATTGWRMLKTHFPKVYEEYQDLEPDPYSPR